MITWDTNLTRQKCQVYHCYTCSFYGERQTPKYFLQALAQLFQEQPALRVLTSKSILSAASMPATRGLSTNLATLCRSVACLPHQQAVQYQVTADALLLVVGKGAGSDVVLTGKIFEYLGAGRPGLVPLDGPAADLIAARPPASLSTQGYARRDSGGHR